MSSLIKASIWLTISELVFNISGYVVHAVLGRMFGPADYGRYSIIIVFSTMVVVLIGRGVPIAMSKYLSEVRKTTPQEILAIKKTGAFIQTILIGIVTVIYFMLAPVFARLLNDPSLTSLFRLSSLIIPGFALASFYVYYFNGIHKFNSQSLIKLYRGIVKVVIIILLALFFKVPGAVTGHILAPFSVFVFAFMLDPFRKHKALAGFTFPWKKLLIFAWPITIFMIFYEIMISIDLFLVKNILESDSQTGLYNAALTIGRIPFYAFYFLTIILLPKISESTSQNNTLKTSSILNNSMRFLFILLIPVTMLLSLFSQSAARFFYGAKFSASSGPLTILAFGMGFLTVFYILAFVLNGAGKNKFPMVLSVFGAILNTILSYIFIKSKGIDGAAYAITITSFILTAISIWYVNSKITTFFSFKKIMTYLSSAYIMYFMGDVFFDQGRFIFILWSILLLGIYFLILFVVGEFDKNDLHYLLGRKKAISNK